MTRFPVHPKQDGCGRFVLGVALQQSGEFSCVHGMDTVVVFSSGDEHAGVLTSFHHVVVGGIGQNPAQIFLHFRVPVFGNPEFGHQELGIAHHVQQGHHRNTPGPEVVLLHGGDAGQQSSVGTTHRDQGVGLGDAGRHQMFTSSAEVVEDILFACKHAILVPGFAKLSAATQVHRGIDAACFNPRHHAADESRGDGDVEAAVAIHDGWCGAFAAGLPHHKHRNPRPIFADAPLTLDVNRLRIERKIGGRPHAGLIVCEVNLQDLVWGVEGCITDKRS